MQKCNKVPRDEHKCDWSVAGYRKVRQRAGALKAFQPEVLFSECFPITVF